MLYLLRVMHIYRATTMQFSAHGGPQRFWAGSRNWLWVFCLSPLCQGMATSAWRKVCCCSVAKSCSSLCHPMDCSTPGSSVLHSLPEFAQTHVLESMIASNHLVLCHSLLLLPSIFLSIRVFSSELALHIRWPKYWNFGFSIWSF